MIRTKYWPDHWTAREMTELYLCINRSRAFTVRMYLKVKP